MSIRSAHAAFASLVAAGALASACGRAEVREDGDPGGAAAPAADGDCGPAPGSLWRRVDAILSARTMRLVVSTPPKSKASAEAAARVLERRLRDRGIKVDRVLVTGRKIEVVARSRWRDPEALEPLLRAGRLTIHEVADELLEDLLVRESARFDSEKDISVLRMDGSATNLMSGDEEALRSFLASFDVAPRTWGVERAGDTYEPTFHAFLLEPASVTGAGLLRCETEFDRGGWTPELQLRLSEPARRALEALTSRALGSRIAVVVDGEVVSAPVVHEVIAGESLRISRTNDPYSMDALALLLRTGELEAPLQLVSLEEIAPLAP